MSNYESVFDNDSVRVKLADTEDGIALSLDLMEDGEPTAGTTIYIGSEQIDGMCAWLEKYRSARPEALRIDDVGAVAWAYRKLKAFGVHTGTIDSAMMMDRLNAILTTECPGTQASSVGAVPAPSAPSPLAQKQEKP